MFASLLLAAFVVNDHDAAQVLGWTHGIGFLFLCALIYVACLRRAVPWPVLASAVLLTPFGSSVHLELLRRRWGGRSAPSPSG